jgi:hypothetical protein
MPAIQWQGLESGNTINISFEPELDYDSHSIWPEIQGRGDTEVLKSRRLRLLIDLIHGTPKVTPTKKSALKRLGTRDACGAVCGCSS